MSAVWNAFLGTLLTYGVTAAGAALVFVLPSGHPVQEQKLLDGSLGFAAGVMVAASFFSLLAPAVELSVEHYGESLSWFPAVVGFMTGAAFVYAGDKFGPADGLSAMLDLEALAASKAKKDDDIGRGGHAVDEAGPSGDLRRRGGNRLGEAEAGAAVPSTPKSTNVSLAHHRASLRRVLLLVFAVTLHNAPEGLAVGVGFGAVGVTPGATLSSAWSLAIGIALQNFPEGFAVSVPLHRSGMSKSRAFFFGQLSGMVEPIAGLLGAMFVSMRFVLPYALSFAAGAMIWVVVDSIIPETASSVNATLASWGAMVGFCVMMAMDVGLG